MRYLYGSDRIIIGIIIDVREFQVDTSIGGS